MKRFSSVRRNPTVVKREGGDRGIGKVYRASMEMKVTGRCRDH